MGESVESDLMAPVGQICQWALPRLDHLTYNEERGSYPMFIKEVEQRFKGLLEPWWIGRDGMVLKVDSDNETGHWHVIGVLPVAPGGSVHLNGIL